MKKKFILAFIVICFLAVNNPANAQGFKAGVFDIDMMVQAMPGYRVVDSLVQIYEQDTLGALLEYDKTEYQRLDSIYKNDSALVASGKRSKVAYDKVGQQRQQIGLELVYWQQISQNKSNNKRSELSADLYKLVIDAYKKVLVQKKYTLILKPQTYEAGFPIDNIFIAVARELKLESLPQQLLGLGDDPGVKQQPAAQKAPVTKKPKS